MGTRYTPTAVYSSHCPKTNRDSVIEQHQHPSVLPTCFEEMAIPHLSLIESGFTGLSREIAITLKKCEKFPGSVEDLSPYSWITLDKMVQWLQRPRPPIIMGGAEKKYADISSCMNAVDFHIIWKNSDYQLSKLLRRWMHTMIRNQNENFVGVENIRSLNAGDHVAVWNSKDGKWYRAEVIQRMGYHRVSVYLVDEGSKIEVGLGRIMLYPQDLHPPKAQPLAFRCQIDGLENYSDSVISDVTHTFIKSIKDILAFRVAVHKAVKKTNALSVTLWDFLEDNNINTKVIYAAEKFAARPNNALNFTTKDMIQDAATMVHMNYEIKIRDFSETRVRGLRNWRVTKIVDPSEFYMEYVYEHTADKVTAAWYQEMQDFYNNPLDRKHYELRTTRVYKSRSYVWNNKAEESWERIRTITSDAINRTAEVYMIDIGARRMVSYDDIFEICTKFCTYSAQAFKAHLVDVVPPNGAPTWPSESIDAFKYLVMDNKTVQGIMINGRIIPSLICQGEETMELGVILIEKSYHINYTVQSTLVFFGLADASGVSSCRPDIFEGTAFGMKEGAKFVEYMKYREEGRSTDLSSEGVNQLIKERLEMNKTRTSTSDFLSAYRLSAPAMDDWTLPKSVQTVLAAVDIVHVLHPGCMYVRRKDTKEVLQGMITDIGEQVKGTCQLELSSLKVGDMVAVNHLLRFNEERCWYRACIRVIGNAESIQIILADFGIELSVKLHHIRNLPDSFKTIPGFAFRVHLDAPNILPVGSVSWSHSCRTNFPRYINSWEAVGPNYYIWCPPTASVFSCKTMYQQVFYSRESNTWKLNPLTERDMLDPLKDFRTHCMLRNLFQSHGIMIDYEIRSERNLTHYSFEHISDILIKLRHAIALDHC